MSELQEAIIIAAEASPLSVEDILCISICLFVLWIVYFFLNQVQQAGDHHE